MELHGARVRKGTSQKATTTSGAGLYPSWKSSASALQMTVVSLGGSRGTKHACWPARSTTLSATGKGCLEQSVLVRDLRHFLYFSHPQLTL